MEKNNPIPRWWAYRHIDGEIVVKHYLNDFALNEADQSSFVTDRTEPFVAIDLEEARKTAKLLL